MGFWDRLLKAEHNIRKRVENAFGMGTAQTPLEMRREILEQVDARIVIDTKGKHFPFGKVTVQLLPPNDAMRDVFEAAFLQDDSLKSDMLDKLRDSEATFSNDLQMVVEVAPVSNSGSEEPAPLFRLDFAKPAPSQKPEIPEARLSVIKGASEKPEYRLKKERILIGRLSEVMDREGRMVRKNDVVFVDNEDDVNTTVGRSHARIWFDFERREFCIMDEASRFGTRIIREGRSIDVPGNSRGIRLRSGDEIYFGQACLRFDL